MTHSMSRDASGREECLAPLDGGTHVQHSCRPACEREERLASGHRERSMSASREVIQDWADGEGGFTFERGRMEKAVRAVCLENPVKLHTPNGGVKQTLKLNKDDVDFIVSGRDKEDDCRGWR